MGKIYDLKQKVYWSTNMYCYFLIPNVWKLDKELCLLFSVRRFFKKCFPFKRIILNSKSLLHRGWFFEFFWILVWMIFWIYFCSILWSSELRTYFLDSFLPFREFCLAKILCICVPTTLTEIHSQYAQSLSFLSRNKHHVIKVVWWWEDSIRGEREKIIRSVQVRHSDSRRTVKMPGRVGKTDSIRSTQWNQF